MLPEFLIVGLAVLLWPSVFLVIAVIIIIIRVRRLRLLELLVLLFLLHILISHVHLLELVVQHLFPNRIKYLNSYIADLEIIIHLLHVIVVIIVVIIGVIIILLLLIRVYSLILIDILLVI